MKKAIVSGANGFVGTALCKELANQGVAIIAIVRNSNSNIESLNEIKGIRIVYADLSDYKHLDDQIKDKDIDVFYHLAWNGTAGTLRSNSDVQLDNVKHTCDAVRACSRMQCQKFIFASSIMEYEIESLMQTERTPILDQPQIMCIAECLDCGQVKRIAQRMCNHDRLGLGRKGCFQFSNINVVLRNRHIHKHRHCAILDGRGHSGGEPAGNGDNFIALLDLAVAQLRGSQSHKGNQVRGRATVYQMRILNSNPLCKLLFKLICKTTSRQPEIQRFYDC